MTYNPIDQVTLTRADGSQEELKRCGLYPNTYASRDGSIFQVEESEPFMHGKASAVRAVGRTNPVKYLVADAWMEDWEKHGEVIQLQDPSNPFATNVENLQVVPIRGRGRPRGGKQLEELEGVEVARLLGNIQHAAEELGMDEVRLANWILKWTPQAILDFDDVPAQIARTGQYNTLLARHRTNR